MLLEMDRLFILKRFEQYGETSLDRSQVRRNKFVFGRSDVEIRRIAGCFSVLEADVLPARDRKPVAAGVRSLDNAPVPTPVIERRSAPTPDELGCPRCRDYLPPPGCV